MTAIARSPAPHVVIVGGGGTGGALALDLVLRGLRVTLVERGEITSGTTGRHHGLLHSGARYAVARRVFSQPRGPSPASCLNEANRSYSLMASSAARATRSSSSAAWSFSPYGGALTSTFCPSSIVVMPRRGCVPNKGDRGN